MNIDELLRDEIQSELEKLKDMEVGSDEYKATVDGLTKLTDRTIEFTKIESESNDKQKQLEEDRKDRLIKNCISVAGIVIPSMITIWGTCKSFEFEKTGTITTILGRGFINKLLPRK